MHQRGHDVGLVVPRAGTGLTPCLPDGVELFHVPALRVKLVGQHIHLGFTTPRAMSGILRRFDPDIVHVQTPMAIGHAVARATQRHRTRLVVTNHSLPEITLKNLGGRRGMPPSMHTAVLRSTVSLDRRADAVVVPSASAMQELYGTRPFRGKDLIAISNGVDTDFFSPAPAREGQPSHPDAAHEPTVLFVGRVDQDKDIGTLLRAISLIPREHGVHLRIVGDGKYMNEARSLVARLGVSDRVVFTGWLDQEDLLEEYRAAATFCLPSIYETQSIATLEAMAVGLPVVVSDGGAVKDLCAHGVNGYVCRGGDPQSFATELDTICSTPGMSDAMGGQSRTFALTHSVAVPIERHESLYRSLMRGEGARGPTVHCSSTAREVLGNVA